MKLIKNKCEIESCNVTDECALHFHHIIERVKVTSTNSIWNTAILCASCHEKTHSRAIKNYFCVPFNKTT